MAFSVKTDSSALELAVHGFIQPKLAGVCDFVKVGSRNASKNPPKSVYCNATSPIVDQSAISQTIMRIEIYVEQIGGFKDTTGLSAIRNVIMKAIGDGVTLDKTYFINLSNELSRPDGNGFDFIFLNLNVTII